MASMIRNIPLERLPKHIAFIMDGNGRWAKARKMPRWVGHREGAKAIEKVVSQEIERIKSRLFSDDED